MKLAHLGDALDAWKGWVIETIRDETPRLRVLPMLTDQPHWGYDHFVRYAAMLGVPNSAILLRFTAFPPHPRVRYFEEALRQLEPNDDVFLDPDTGIKRVKGRRTRNAHPEHVTTHELALLMPSNSHRLAVVYRQGRETAATLEQSMTSLVTKYMTGCHAFALLGGSVGAAFLSRSADRLIPVRALLAERLNPMEAERLTPVVTG